MASLRWRVGMDCNSYIRLFYHPQESFEVGFNKLIEWVKYTGANHVPYLFILAFLEIFFFYYAFKWEKIYYLFIPFVLFCSSEYFMMMNGIRQTIACCVFVYVSTQCDKGDILKNKMPEGWDEKSVDERLKARGIKLKDQEFLVADI